MHVLLQLSSCWWTLRLKICTGYFVKLNYSRYAVGRFTLHNCLYLPLWNIINIFITFFIFFLFSSFLNAAVTKRKTLYFLPYAPYQNWFPTTTFAPYLPKIPTTTIRGPNVVRVHVYAFLYCNIAECFQGDWAVSNSFVRIASFYVQIRHCSTHTVHDTLVCTNWPFR